MRTRAFGQGATISPVDRFGIWLSGRQIRRHVPSFRDLRVGDFGCGYDARFCRTIVDTAAHLVLVDVALADDLLSHPKIDAHEGDVLAIAAELPSGSLDVVLCVSVLEHLWDAEAAIREFRRVLAPGGICLLNVPSWLGKHALELSAFRLGWSPADEMDDHKMYYAPRDLWPVVVRAGFRPRDIRCFRHKLGLNTFAACRARETSE